MPNIQVPLFTQTEQIKDLKITLHLILVPVKILAKYRRLASLNTYLLALSSSLGEDDPIEKGRGGQTREGGREVVYPARCAWMGWLCRSGGLLGHSLFPCQALSLTPFQ